MDQLGINGWQLAIQMIAFIVFVFLLWRFALKPIVSVLDQRQARISESMSAAERMQAELKPQVAAFLERDSDFPVKRFQVLRFVQHRDDDG